VGQQELGPTIQAQSVSGRHVAVGVERSPSFFFIKTDHADHLKITEANGGGVEEFLSFSLRAERSHEYPAVELVFTNFKGVRRVVSLHQRECVKVATEARSQGIEPEYISMPLGAEGVLHINGPNENSVIPLSSGCEPAPHNCYMRLPLPDALSKLKSVLANSKYSVEIDFGGFGRLSLAGTRVRDSVGQGELSSLIRFRLLSFLFQLRANAPLTAYADDEALVGELDAARPEATLIPHYRSLVKDIHACGFKLKCLEKGGLL